MHGIERRVSALERRQPTESLQVVFVAVGETREEALMRNGHPPGTDATFIVFVSPEKRPDA
jgi:hypothetical protein